MWQQDAKPAVPSGAEHSHPEAAPGGSAFYTDKWHIKVAAPATASPWGLAQMGEPCLAVVFCFLCLLQPLFFCRDTRQILSSAFLSFIAPLTQFLCPPTAPQPPHSAWWQAGLSRSKEPPKAAVYKPRFWALAAARGARWQPRHSHGSWVAAPRAAGAWDTPPLPAPDQPSCEPGGGHRPWECMPAPEPLPGTRLGHSRRVSNPSSLPEGGKTGQCPARLPG